MAATSATAVASHPSVAGRAAQGADPVHLLGDVGQLEVGGEGPHQVRGRRDGQLGEDLADLVGGGPAIGLGVGLQRLLGQRPHPLDQLEQLWSLLADQRLAEQRGHPADVRTQPVGIGG